MIPTPLPKVKDIYDVVRLSVVKIRSGTVYGSGWAIENGWIITNEHVISGHTSVTVEIPLLNENSVRRVSGLVRGIDTKRDLAAIQVNHGAPVLPTREVSIDDVGDLLISFGYSASSSTPMGYPSVHTGIITTVIRHFGNVLESAPSRVETNEETGGVGVIVFDADADPGDSGGPVVDINGNAIGITFGSVVSTSSGKRVIGQQRATSVKSINDVWLKLKEGTNTSNM